MKTLNLTDSQCSTLKMFILISTNYRKNEEAACKELGREVSEDGTARFPNMEDNGAWWEKANKTIEEINKLLSY